MFGGRRGGGGPEGGGPMGRFGGGRMRGGFGGFGGFGPWRMLGELDLTDDQIEKVAALKLEGLGKLAQLKVALGTFMHQVGEELSKPQIDKDKVRALAKDMRAKHQDFGDAMIERILTFAEILTVEQRKKMRLTAMKRFLGICGEEGPRRGGPGFGGEGPHD